MAKQMTAMEATELRSKVEASGIDWQAFLKALPQLIAILLTLFKQTPAEPNDGNPTV